MKAIYKNRLLKLAKWLMNFKPTEKRAWDFSTVVQFNCKTTACALGWCPTVFPKYFRYTKCDNEDEVTLIGKRIHDNRDDKLSFVAAQKFFEIDHDEAQHLFMPCAQDSDFGVKLDGNATAKQVAKNIIKFVKHKEKARV